MFFSNQIWQDVLVLSESGAKFWCQFCVGLNTGDDFPVELSFVWSEGCGQLWMAQYQLSQRPSIAGGVIPVSAFFRQQRFN